MTTSNSTRERRDWTLLIFLIPIGIIFMLIAGQVAIRLVPIWTINAGMQSNLDPNNLPMQQSGPLQPILPAILTPMGWLDTFLTPGADTGDDVVFPPFIIFHPTITPVVTTPPPTATVTVVGTPSPTIIPVTTSPTVVITPSPTRTPKPTNNPTSTPITPTSTPITSTPTPITPTSTPTNTPTNTPTPITPTPTGTPPGGILVPTPTEIGINTPPDGTQADLTPGTYTVIDITSSPLIVTTSPDGYDLILYESINPTQPDSIFMDNIIIGISHNADGSDYYEVFNWGDNIPDTNTNVNTATLPLDPLCTGPSAPECDNRVIPLNEPSNPLIPILYSPDPTNPAVPQTGILINVDTAPVIPPEGQYNYLVIISPLSGLPDSAQVDSVVVIP